MQGVICTPWGSKYKRHSRIALSGAYVIQAIESWYSTLLIIRASLKVTLSSPERAWPIRRFGVLADDLHVHVLWHFVQRFRMALVEREEFLDSQLKDNVVSIGSAMNFNWLGYDVINGMAYLDEKRLHICQCYIVVK